MLPVVRDERTTIRAIALSTVLLPASTFAFFLAPTFRSGVYLGAAIAAGAVLLVLTARLIAQPTAANAWAGYRFSGPYLATILLAMMTSASLVGPR
jgi:heme O synthase-like polyprenyltransferase